MASPVPALGWRLTKLRSRHWAPSLSLSMSGQSKGADLHDGAGWGWLGPGLLAGGGEDHVTPLAPVTRRNHMARTLMPTRATADRASWKKWPQPQKKRGQVCRSDESIILWNSSQDQEDRWEPLSSTLKVNRDVDWPVQLPLVVELADQCGCEDRCLSIIATHHRNKSCRSPSLSSSAHDRYLEQQHQKDIRPQWEVVKPLTNCF